MGRALLRWFGLPVVVALAAAASGCTEARFEPSPVATSAQADDIVAIARDAMATYHLKAVIVRVAIDGKEVVTRALGESMTGVPATVDMHFRNGAVAISYVSTLLLRLVDQKKVGLDDKLSRWLPDLPNADQVTLRMLANMTAGYSDYEANPEFVKEIYQDPFRAWTPEELIAISTSKPHVFAPGTNWDYAHSNYVILGLALEKITGKPMATLLREEVLDPMGLKNTVGSQTATIPEPALHAFSSERREALGIPAGTRFYEESTYWNPSWSITRGAVETSNIYDMITTAEAVGTGKLLSKESHQAQVSPVLRGFGSPMPGCHACHTLDKTYTYGLGVVISGSWLLQNPLFYGYGAVEAYLPSQKIAIAVAATYGEQAFDENGNYKDGNVAGQKIFRQIGAYITPGTNDDPPTG